MGDAPKPGPAPRPDVPDCVIIRPLPKAIVLYPTAALCLVFGVVGLFFDVGAAPHWMGLSFLFVFGFNLFVMNFEFSRGTAFTITFAVVALIFMGLFFGERWNIPVFASMGGWIRGLDIQANAAFYLAMGSILGLTFVIVWLKSRFDYWEITSNELLHHHGLVGNVERFPAPNLRITKEIHDVFEWLLLRSGRLVLNPAMERRSIVLELVFNVNKKEALIKELLSKLSVDIDDGHLHHSDH